MALSGERSRTEAARAVRGGLVRVNGCVVRDPAMKLAASDEVTLSGASRCGQLIPVLFAA